MYKQFGLGDMSDPNPTRLGIGSGGAERSIVVNKMTHRDFMRHVQLESLLLPSPR
jgi:hypothetical protein